MTQAVLIRNADLYAPEHVGMRDILIAGGKIIAVEPHLENVNIPGMETVDAAGRRVTPGLIDQHIHVTGGGGEGGWASRCPELNFSSLVKGGVTSFMGVSGTDSMSRSIENLLAKVRGLTVEGASGWMWTSNYAYPPATDHRIGEGRSLCHSRMLGCQDCYGRPSLVFPDRSGSPAAPFRNPRRRHAYRQNWLSACALR